MEIKDRPFVSLREAAEKSGIALYWWRCAVRDSRVPYFRSGRKVYVDYHAAISKLKGEAEG